VAFPVRLAQLAFEDPAVRAVIDFVADCARTDRVMLRG
jgi:hypothetical protein